MSGVTDMPVGPVSPSLVPGLRKPLVYIFRLFDIQDLEAFCDVWRSCAETSGLKALYLFGQSRNEGGSGPPGSASSLLGAMTQPQLLPRSQDANHLDAGGWRPWWRG